MATDDPVLAATMRLLDAAWTSVAGATPRPPGLQLVGPTAGLLPSSLAALPAMLAATAASTLAVSVVDAARGPATGNHAAMVELDIRHVAAAAVSERYATLPGSSAASQFAPLSRFWRAADGFVRVHGNYPWHRDRALAVLGCSEDLGSVAVAVRERSCADLEESFAEAGALAFAVRTADQWRAHPQGLAVAELPLIGRREGAGPARPLREGRALQGLRVLDLTRVIAGPVATRTLAAWGADVLRVDSPRLPELEAQCIDTLSGKRSALLDAASAPDRARLEELVSAADVVVQGYRPGALARFGLDPSSLAQRHPHLTVITLSAWGDTGPWAQRRGFDSLVQAPTGIAAAESSVPGEPGALPAQVLDHATGYLAAAAAAMSVAGILTGQPPQHRTLSLAQTAAWLMGEPAGPASAAVSRRCRLGTALTPGWWTSQDLTGTSRLSGRPDAWGSTSRPGPRPHASATMRPRTARDSCPLRPGCAPDGQARRRTRLGPRPSSSAMARRRELASA